MASSLFDVLAEAQADTLPRLRAEAGMPDDDSEPATPEQERRYVELLETAVVGQRVAVLSLRAERGRR